MSADLDLARLKALAENAKAIAVSWPSIRTLVDDDDWTEGCATYIAALDPATVLALIAQAEGRKT